MIKSLSIIFPIFNEETRLETKRIKLAEQAVRLEKERHIIMGKDGVMAEDLDALAELEINLANVRQESAGRQISLQNFINGLRQTEEAEKEAQRVKEQEEEEAAFDKKIDDNNKWNEEQQKSRDLNIAADKKAADDKIKLDKLVKDAKVGIAKDGLALAVQIAGEGTTIGKAAAVAGKLPAARRHAGSLQSGDRAAVCDGLVHCRHSRTGLHRHTQAGRLSPGRTGPLHRLESLLRDLGNARQVPGHPG